MPGSMKDVRDYVTPEDAEKMFCAATGDHERLLLKMLWHSGRRISEVVGEKGITPADIDIDNGLVRFTILKKRGMDPKYKPIDRSFLLELKQYCVNAKLGDGDKVWPETRFWAFRIFRKAAEKAGVKEAGGRLPHPHSFRHSFAVRAVKVSTTPSDMRALQDIMEHGELKTTEIYMQHNPAEARALMDKMGKKDGM